MISIPSTGVLCARLAEHWTKKMAFKCDNALPRRSYGHGGIGVIGIILIVHVVWF